ncbi:MAG: hypothetical protein KF845_10440 [Cyclobacteriaceae bacterium]|nr:hypothetical protein [Cyclobacteriaceae bacterium]
MIEKRSYENESNNWVYFDDMKVTHTKSNVIQYNEYYPFGLQTSASWTRENHSNNYLYNEGSELNSTTGWYEMFYRGYDAALGRMFEVDPFASDFVSLSPYHYVGNNPALLTDPSGGSTPELRELTAMINTPGFFDVWIPGNGIFGHVGPGSGHHWSDNIARGDEAQQQRDYFLLSGSAFEAKYGVYRGDVMFRNGQAGYYQSANTATYGGYTTDKDGTRNFNNDIVVGMRFVPLQQTGGCPPNVDCDYINRAAKDGLLANIVGTAEIGYGLWESDYNHARVTLMYSKSIKGVGLGLSAANSAIGGAQIYNQRKNGQPVNPIDVAQLSVGSVGLFASALNYVGIGTRLTGTIAASAGIFGMVLSIPSSWYNVYKGAYEMQYMSTPYYPSDSEIFGGN